MTEEGYLLPKTTEVVKTLDDSFLDAYRESEQSSYNSNSARETLGLGEDNSRVSSANGRFAGSSPFIQLHLLHMDENNKDEKGENKGQLALPNNTKPATREDLENAIARDKRFLSGLYADFGIAIWEEPEVYNPNKLAYEVLAKQFKDRDISLGNGKLIYFSGLSKPREDKNSGYGLVLDLRDIDTNELNNFIRDTDSFKWDFKKGKGLARACRDYRGWLCDFGHLDYSDSRGRVVGVGVEDAKDLTFGYSDEQLKSAFDKAGIPANYDLVMQHLQSK